jgi:hypothetical protein
MNIEELNLSCLEARELNEIFGGDKFMHDLGYALGVICAFLEDMNDHRDGV